MRKTKSVLFLVIVLTTIVFENARALSIEAKLKPNEHITLFFGGTRMIRLKNASDIDSTIRANVTLRTFTEVFYSFGFRDENNQSKTFVHTMIIGPADNLVFKKNGRDLEVVNKRRDAVFLNDNIEAGSKHVSSIWKPIITSQENFQKFVQSEKIKLSRDSIKIDSLQNAEIIDQETAAIWQNFRKITYYASIFQVVKSKQINFNPFQIVNQSLYNEALESINPEKTCINGNLTSELLGYLNTYWKQKQKENKELHNVDFYISERNRIHPLYIRGTLLGYMDNAILKKSSSYSQLVEKIKEYAVKHDKILYEKAVSQKFFDMAQIHVTDINNKTFTLDQIATMNGKKYLLLDMWASWCAPCREQLPVYHKIKSEMRSDDIAFLSISTDNSVDDWQKALVQEKMKYSTNQFRLSKMLSSEFINFFDLRTIPRYIILENNGRVISDRFFLPTEDNFKSVLSELLKSK